MRRGLLLLLLAACSSFENGDERTARRDAGAPDAATVLALRAVASSTAFNDAFISVPPPAGTQAGDLLVAFLDVGDSDKDTRVEGIPPGWANRLMAAGPSGDTVTYVYMRFAAANEEPFVATAETGKRFSGLAWVFAFSGATSAAAVETAYNAGSQTLGGSIETGVLRPPPQAGDVLLAAFVGFHDDGVAIPWTPPAGFTIAATAAREKRSGIVALRAADPSAGPFEATFSGDAAFATATLIHVRR